MNISMRIGEDEFARVFRRIREQEDEREINENLKFQKLA